MELLGGLPQQPWIPQDITQGVLAVAAFVVLILVSYGLMALHDEKRRGVELAAALQARLSDALLMDLRFFGLPLAATVRVPLGSHRIVVELTGSVPDPELHEAAVRLVVLELQEHLTSTRIRDRIEIDPAVSEGIYSRILSDEELDLTHG